MDERVRSAVDASVEWYADVWATRNSAWSLRDGLWVSSGSAPPFYSDVQVVEPSVTPDAVRRVLGNRRPAGVKDSFATLDLSPDGFTVLFEASWIHRSGRGRPPASGSWERLATVGLFEEWNVLNATQGVLRPELLDDDRIAVLVRRENHRVVAGAIARLCTGVVYLSNVATWAERPLDWAELADAVWRLFPDRALVGYERGTDLAGAVAGGFEPTGALTIWVRG